MKKRALAILLCVAMLFGVMATVASAAIPAYRIEPPATLKNGTLEVSHKYASVGTIVTLTVKPNVNYVVDVFSVTNNRDRELELTDLGNGVYQFQMPKCDVQINLAYVKYVAPTSPFEDVALTDYFFDAVKWALDSGYANGTDETHFSPKTSITRAMVVTMLWRMAGEPYVDFAMNFTDIPADTWYTPAVRWAQAEKIVSGYSDGTFRPNEPVTREQLAVILYNYAKTKGEGFTGSWMFLLDFADREKISEWADEAVHWCSMKGIVQGDANKNFNPQAKASRADVVTMLQRLYDALTEVKA